MKVPLSHMKDNSENYQEPLSFSIILFDFMEGYFSCREEDRLKVGWPVRRLLL